MSATSPRSLRPTGRGEAQPGRLPPCASADVGVAARRDERTFSRPGISPRPVGLPSLSFTLWGSSILPSVPSV